MAVTVTILRKRAQFVQLRATGQRVPTPAFVVQALPAEGTGIELGYTASSHTIGNAVQRNRARRRLKAVVDEVLRLNPAAQAPQGFTMALVARPDVLTRPYDDMVKDLRKALAKLGFSWEA